jgi:hypothetical protein
MVPGAQAMPSFRNQETGVWAIKGKPAIVPRPWYRKVGLGYFSQKDVGRMVCRYWLNRSSSSTKKRGSLARISR